MTRRTVLGASLAFAAMARTAGSGAHEQTARHRHVRSIDALLIDEGIEMPRQMAAFIKTGKRTLPVVRIQLDAAAHTELKRVFDRNLVVVGISSGATLFCLERIAWDHGFRLTGRTQQCVENSGENACWLDVAAFVTGTLPAPASASAFAQAYRPSRTDGTLHAWIMQKSAHREA